MAGSGVLQCSSGLLSLAFFLFFLVLNLSVCDLIWSSLHGKGLEVEKLECCGETWLSQHALGTPDRTSPSPSPAPTEPTSHKPLAQSVSLPSRLVQRLQVAADTPWHLPASGWVLGREAQGALEDRTRGMRRWMEGGQPGGVWLASPQCLHATPWLPIRPENTF